MRSDSAPGRRIGRWGRVGSCAAALGLALLAGCVTETRPVRPTATTDRSQPLAAEPVLPLRYEQRTVFAKAAVAPLAQAPYDGQMLPLVRPGGGYIAVQEVGSPTWDTLLATPDALVPPRSVIVVYRVEQDPKTARLSMTPSHRLIDLGILGRNADEHGFLVESPRPDGSRWIGKVQWNTGDVEWLVDGPEVNAFAALGPGGRLAWSQRSTGSETFDLVVEGEDGLLRLPSTGGDWLLPVWANDGRTIFAFEVAPTGALDLVALDCRSQEHLARAQSRRPLVLHGTAAMAYQALAAIQDPADPHGAPRMLFFHPGYGRTALFDVRKPGVTLLARETIGGVWGVGGVILASEEALYRQTVDGRVGEPALLWRGNYLPKYTGAATHPFVMFAPVTGRPDRIQVYAMAVTTDPEQADAFKEF